MANKQQTALEWFAERIQSDKIFSFDVVLKQALQMEREQIVESYIRSKTEEIPYGLDYLDEIDSIRGKAKRYYTQTYSLPDEKPE